MKFAQGAIAGITMAALGDSLIPLRPLAMPQRGWREQVKRLTIAHSANTPRPEVMYASMLAAGSARLIRRKGKPPLLVRS